MSYKKYEKIILYIFTICLIIFIIVLFLFLLKYYKKTKVQNIPILRTLIEEEVEMNLDETHSEDISLSRFLK